MFRSSNDVSMISYMEWKPQNFKSLLSPWSDPNPQSIHWPKLQGMWNAKKKKKRALPKHCYCCIVKQTVKQKWPFQTFQYRVRDNYFTHTTIFGRKVSGQKKEIVYYSVSDFSGNVNSSMHQAFIKAGRLKHFLQ